MSPLASHALIGALVLTVAIWIVWEIRHAAPDPTALKWAEIAEDFAPDEFELLRRADRMMAGAEAKVLREWTDRPYDHEREGL